jgi:hypothetical protein
MSGAIQQDAQSTDIDYGMTGLDETGNAFLKLFADKSDAKKPSEGEAEEKKKPAPTEETETPTTEDAETPSEGEEEEVTEEVEETNDKSKDDPSKAKKVADDDAVVKFTVGDEEHVVPVSELKRLAGQEKAITQRGMDVANKRRELDEQATKHVAAAEQLRNRAIERYKPYATVQWDIALKELEPDQYRQLRAAAEAAYADVKFLDEDLNGYMKDFGEKRQKALVEEARASLKELSDPVTGIKGFDQNLYNEMRQHAVSIGLPQKMVDELTSAPAWRLIHQAMMYAKGSKVVTKTVDKGVKKIVKNTAAPAATRPVTKTQTKAMENFKQTGTVDDAAEAFLERWRDKD